MTVKINYKTNILKKTATNLIVFVDEKYNTKSLKNHISNQEYSYINDLLKTCDVKKNLLVFEISSKKKNNFSIS